MTTHLLYFHANKTNRGQENSVERWWFNSMFFNKFKKKLGRGCGLNKSMDSLGPIENTCESGDPNLKDRVKNINSWKGRANSSSNNLDSFFGIKDIRNLISDDTFLVRDSKGDNYSIMKIIPD